MGIGKAQELKARIERVKSICKELSDLAAEVMHDAITVNAGISAPLKKAICGHLLATIDLCGIIPGIGVVTPKRKYRDDVRARRDRKDLEEREESTVPGIKAPGVGVMQ